MSKPKVALLCSSLVLLISSLAATGPATANSRPDSGKAPDRRSVVARPNLDFPDDPSESECTATRTGVNTRLDCDDIFPNNEPDVEVNPTDPNHIVVSSNDYGSCCDQFYTTLDGGDTWETGNMSKESDQKTGSDPVTVFDTKSGNVLHSSLNYSFNANGEACDGDLVVSISRDRGITWDSPVVVDDGIGCDLSAFQSFNDKEWIVTDNYPDSPFYGRTYLTWSKFYSSYGEYLSSAIWSSHSDDGGMTWSDPHMISGSNLNLCTFQTSGPAGQCDENQFSVGTVAPNGHVFVAFQNGQNESLWEAPEEFDNQYLVVRSFNGGRSWSNPRFAAGLEDGTMDYPVNVDGRQTLTGYQVRVNSAGNIVADPNNGKLYLTYSDNRNGISGPNPVTDTDVFVQTSFNGARWSRPTLVDSSKTDQWFPWAEVNPVTGRVAIIYNDRSSTNPALGNATLAEQTGAGSFSHTIVNTAPSRRRNSEYFQAEVPGCEFCATFDGDYIGLSYGSDGVANMAWTDMRDKAASGHFLQFIYFAQK